jgi:hypothetical protein
MSRITLCAGALAGLGLAACSIPNTAFHASADGGSGDDMSDVLSIVVSKQAVELDEGTTADFTVKLSQAPTSPIEIDLSSGSQKIGLSMQKLFFDASNFAVDQSITVTGVLDDDTATELADIKLAGTGVSDVTVGATVHDSDKVAIVTDVGAGGTTVGEGTAKDLRVHLSHRPPGDVLVTATMSAGPVTVSPPSRVFHMDDDFSTDATFTLSAPPDQNVVNEMQTVTFAIAGGDQKIIQVVDSDDDQLAILPDLQSIPHLREGGTGVTLNITLSLQPAEAVTVMVTRMTGKVQVSTNSVIFQTTGNDYMMPHPVTITAPQDADTSPEDDTILLTMANHAEVARKDIPVQIDDDDVQAIQTTVTNSLTVAEGGMAPFGVTLRFAPTGTFTVNLSSMDPMVATAEGPGGANFLTFTQADYNDPTMHQVTVKGSQDNNLVGNSTKVRLVSGTLETDVNIDVNDDDSQAFTLSQTAALTIPENASRTFTARLAFVPTATVHAVFSSTSSALQVSPPFADFTAANWNMPVTVTVTAPVDRNNLSETGTISATAAPIPTASFTATVADATVIETQGWPTPFSATRGERASAVIAYPVHIGTTTLDLFGIYVPNASGAFRMALYADNGNKPGALVGTPTSQFSTTTLVNGINIVDIPDVSITVGDYWIALRVSATTNVGASTATGRRCSADFDIVGLANNWPADFGSSSCADTGLINIWTTTYHQ